MDATDLIKLELHIPKNPILPLSRYDYESVFETIWTLQYYVRGEATFLRIGRTGEHHRGLVCICDITGPDMRLYLEYFFGIEDIKRILIPAIDMRNPVTLTCRVMKKFETPLTSGLEGKIDLWTIKDTWFFPRGIFNYQKWNTGFNVVFRSGPFCFQFMVILDRDGVFSIHAVERNLAHLYIRGIISFGSRDDSQTFRACWMVGELQKYLCQFNLSRIRGQRNNSPFLSFNYKLFLTTDPTL